MARLFGFSFDDDLELSPSTLSPVPPSDEDGSDFYLTSGFFGSYIDIEGIYRTEFELIRRYREMSLHPEVDSAIEDIVNEAIVSDTNDSPIQIELSNLNVGEDLKNTIRKEFKYILELLDFDKKAHEIYRNWFVDGRLYYHKVIDIKKPEDGILDLRYIDALKMRYVRQELKVKNDKAVVKEYGDSDPKNYKFPKLEEYFIYTPTTSYPVGTPKDMNAGQEKTVKFARDSVVYCTSGLVDRNKGTTLSYLNKASKTLNQLRMIEDSLVIYRLLRSSERRVFYIDVGNLPKQKAEQYLRDVMLRYRNRSAYSTADGTIRDDKKFMSIMDDFFLPRREGGRGTQLDIVPGGCLAMDTKVSLLDGRDLSISDIENELKEGKNLWTYSCHPTTGEFSPGLISWAGVTQKSAKVMKITLDNGESVVCTYDHKFPIYDVGFVEAKDLEVDTMLISSHKNGTESFIFIDTIEHLTEEIEVGTLTIDDNEILHDYHTFALSCGIYTKNSNLGELTDINYFQRKLYKDLNVPESRIGGDSGFNLGRSSEILRDEVKFSKFVGRLRKRFSTLFTDLLKTQLILKNIITPEDWKVMNEHIQFDFLYDNHFAELKESELLSERLNTAQIAEPYIGVYFSQDYVRRKILRQTDQEIVEEDAQIKKEIKNGVIPDPKARPEIDPKTGQPVVTAGNNINSDMGKVPIEPKVDTSAVEAPKGGEI
jgi:hypothetical protein